MKQGGSRRISHAAGAFAAFRFLRQPISPIAPSQRRKPTGSNRAVLPIPPFWSEARLAIRAAPEIRFVIPRQLRIALRELSPIASLCARSHAVLGPRKCLVETDPPRPTRLRRSKRRVRCNRETSWRWPTQTGCPFTRSSSPLRHFLYGIMQMSRHRRPPHTLKSVVALPPP